MKPIREVIGEELLRQISPAAKLTEDWMKSADDVIRALEAAGYVVLKRNIELSAQMKN